MAELAREDLRDIQGFILSGYKHQRFAEYLFLQVRIPAQARAWLDGILPEITTARRWEQDADGNVIKPEFSLNIGFTHDGLVAWGLSEEVLLTFPREFILGIAQRARVLGDSGESAPENWEVGGPENPPVHIILRISASDERSLADAVAAQRDAIAASNGGVVEIHSEGGTRPEDGKVPFGFRDGISNPLIEGTPGNPKPSRFVVRTGEFIMGHLNEYDLYPPSPSVPASDDPDNLLRRFPENALPNCRDLGANGSFLVYRKLENDVAGFWRYLEDQSRRPDGSVDHDEAVKTAAKMFGRWPSGAPMVLAPNKDEPDLADENEFTYESDPKGFACPYGSHVRRANPRASFVNDTPDESFKKSNRHRIIRRAVNYEDRPLFNRAMLEKREVPTALKDDGSRRGVHFFVINVSFRQQFELVQQTWCNKGSFNALFDTKDPIVGDNDGTGYMSIERRPVRKRLAGVPRFVIVRGGGYYFLPGVTALRYLAASRSPARRPEVDAGIPERSIWSELRQKSAKTVGLFLGLLTARW